ncbi:MAG TPA: hypothetical protein VEQ59_07100 [Polyangiaceae bacterium]|nr:hypothetical protein [Polyangiaceae bacterium]
MATAVEGEAPSVADELLDASMAVYNAARVELGSSSVLVTAPLVSFASESVLSGHFLNLAAAAGLDTERGATLLEMAHACQRQAQRAMTAALAALKALPTRDGPTGANPLFTVDE